MIGLVVQKHFEENFRYGFPRIPLSTIQGLLVQNQHDFYQLSYKTEDK